MVSLFDVYLSEKHAASQGKIRDCLQTLILNCLIPRTEMDSIRITGAQDLSCLLGFSFLSLDDHLAPGRRLEVKKILIDFFSKCSQ